VDEMSAVENPKENTEPDEVDIPLIATITVVGALLVIAIAAALTALVRVEQTQHGRAVGAYADLGSIARMKEEQNVKLNAAPKWADKSQGLVSIPIDRAIGLVTADIQRNPALATPSPPEESEADAGAEDTDGAAAPADLPGTEQTDQPGGGSATGEPEAVAPEDKRAPQPENPPAPGGSRQERVSPNGATPASATKGPTQPAPNKGSAPAAGGETGGRE
jgi:hypothetical protein